MKTPYLDEEIERLESFKNPITEHIEQLKEFKAIKEALSIHSVSEPLIIDPITVHPIAKDGHLEIEMYEEYTYLTTEETKQLIDYLTKSINAR